MFSAGNLFPYDFFFQLVIISSSSSGGSSLPRDLNTEPQKPVLDGNECVMQKKKEEGKHNVNIKRRRRGATYWPSRGRRVRLERERQRRRRRVSRTTTAQRPHLRSSFERRLFPCSSWYNKKKSTQSPPTVYPFLLLLLLLLGGTFRLWAMISFL